MADHAVVAGGAGFIGAHLCRALLDLGWRVTCVDNLSTGSRNAIARLQEDPRMVFLEADVRSLPPLRPARWVFNLACPASPKQYQQDPVGTLMSSVEGTRNLLEYCAATDARFLQASTSEVYGCPIEHPQQEDYWGNVNPLGSRACYDEGKRCAESLCEAYRSTRGVSVRIARIFNTYGPGMREDDGRVIPNLVQQALDGRPMTVYGDGSQTRSFCYIADLVDGLLRLIESEDEHLGPVNLGNPAEVSILQLAQLIRAMTAVRSRVLHEPRPEGDPGRRRPDISKATRALSWRPRVNLKEGLSRYLDSLGQTRKARYAW